MKPRIFLYAGYVKSRSDGDYHLITIARLAELCHIPEGCYVTEKPGMEPGKHDICLYPQDSGDYSQLPEVKAIVERFYANKKAA